jgi:sugar/nucleoside kinase (ribokinase family)
VTGSLRRDLPDYVLLGHICRDLHGDMERPGGTVLYAGVTALRLGRRVGIVTSHGSELTLPSELADAEIVNLPARETTTFRHRYESTGRVLTLVARASNITADDVPELWRSAEIVHLAPVAWEVDHEIALLRPPEHDRDLAPLAAASTLVATVQGWLRRATDSGVIAPAIDEISSLPLPTLAAVVLSADDVQDNDQILTSIAARCPIVAVTRARAGCTLYTRGIPTEIPPWPAHETDSTGAGDVFATAFFIRLRETGNAPTSARFAAWVAARSVEGEGVSSIPTRQQVEQALADLAQA